jgi:hemolysin III
VHAVAFAAALPPSAFLVFSASNGVARAAACIFAAGVLLVYGTSAAYHTLARTERAKRIMRRIDHAMIFVLIAATLTPLCALGLPRSWSIPVLAAVWAGAIGGIVLKLTAFGRYQWFGYALYPILGGAMLVVFPMLAHRLSAAPLTFVVLGVVAYCAGGLLFIAKRPNPWPATFGYHEMWHLWTVLAAAFHFAAVGLIVR